jgi:acetate kinase
MDDYALVLNAGSLSLKFCGYRRPSRGNLAAGTSPRLSAKALAAKSSWKRVWGPGCSNGRAAREALASWLRSKFGGARILDVGHRVLHGGTRCDRLVVVNRQVLTELHELVPLAHCINPTTWRSKRSSSECRMCHKLPASTRAFNRGHAPVAQVIPLPREICKADIQRYGFHGLLYAPASL